MIKFERWSVVQDSGDRIEIHHECYSGPNAEEKCQERAKILKSQGLNVFAKKILPVRKSLPYQGIARRPTKINDET